MVRTLTFDKVTGELVDETEWSPNKTKYYDIYAPVVLGYFADRVEVKGREVTEDNIEETITYVPLGKIIPIDANGRLIPNVPTPTFNNDANNPTKVSETLVPHIPGYRPMQQSVMPESLTDDILVEYAPILEDVTQPTLQTVFFKGAGEATPSVNIQSDFTFTGKYNQAEDTYTWDQDSHTFAKVNVPVIEGYYADKAVAGMQIVTPDKPEATDSVVYKELGKIIPVDTFGNPIADAEPVHYANDPQDATQVIETPAPQVAGYQAEVNWYCQLTSAWTKPWFTNQSWMISHKIRNKRLPSKVQATKIQLSTFKIASASTVNLTKWNKQALGIKTASLTML